MGVFINTLRTDRPITDGAEAELTAPLLFDSAVLGRVIEVPAGFRADFAWSWR